MRGGASLQNPGLEKRAGDLFLHLSSLPSGTGHCFRSCVFGLFSKANSHGGQKSLVTLAIVKLDKVHACGPNWETEAGRAYMQDLDRPSLNQEKLPLVLGMNHESLWDNHAKSVLLALMHRWGNSRFG